MRVTKRVLIIAGAVTASLSGAAAQAPQAPVDFILQEGFSEVVEIPGAIHNLAVGDPDIIDAQPLTSNTFLLNGIEQGTTNIIVLNDQGGVLYRARVHVRPVRIWPGYRISVVHGTSLRGGYSCDRDAGCQAQEFQPVAQPQPMIFNLGDTVVNTSATAVGTGVGGGGGGDGAQSAPPAE